MGYRSGITGKIFQIYSYPAACAVSLKYSNVQMKLYHLAAALLSCCAAIGQEKPLPPGLQKKADSIPLKVKSGLQEIRQERKARASSAVLGLPYPFANAQ